jgi:hypothetical protein
MIVKPGRAAQQTPILSTLLRRAAVRATTAASVRNSQPWQLELHSDHLVVRADRGRWLSVFDPTKRQLLLSCGAAVLNARVALAAADVAVDVCRGRDAERTKRPGDLAVLRVRAEAADADCALSDLDGEIERRRSSWGPFTGPAAAGVVAALVATARAEGADLVPIAPDAAARSARLAARVLDEDPAYLAELRAWRTVDPRRRDGLPCGARAVGPDATGKTWLPDDLDWQSSSCLVLSTSADASPDWLRAGEALQRILLVATALQISVHVMSLPIEVPSSRELIAVAAGREGHPQLVLRVGSAQPAPPSARRRLVEVIRTVGIP